LIKPEKVARLPVSTAEVKLMYELSTPELFVSMHSIKDGEADLAIGNIFGSNAFNMLIVVSVPALITPLRADEVVMELGFNSNPCTLLVVFLYQKPPLAINLPASVGESQRAWFRRG